ncbi:MAG: hypothetical protein AAB557_00240 [Patescibacteria group bacterium]
MLIFATLISRLLDPLWVMTAVSILGAYHYGLHNGALWRIVVLMTVVMVLPQVVLRLLFARANRSSGWDIKSLKHRPLVIGVLLVFGILNIVLAKIFGNQLFMNLFLFYEYWLLGFFLISLIWKMSGHAGGIALATGLVIHWFGWGWWPILTLVPLVAWARVVTKNHTVGQVVAGAVYSWGMIVIFQNRIIVHWIPAFAGMTGQ